MKRVALIVTIFLVSSMPGYVIAEIDPVLGEQVKMLNELTERRRINTFFVNEQSLFNGVQKGYVNVGKGNFTFVRRDLVTVGRVPVIFARVYDSSYTGPTDFAGGWRLSAAEIIRTRSDGTLVYLDDSSTLTRFTPTGSDYRITPAQPSDIASLQPTENGFLVSYRNGWTKRFKHMGSVARLVRVTDNNGNGLRLHYDGENNLKGIQGQNGRYVRISRDAQGRISSIEDDQGRNVFYEYNQQGNLRRVTDLGGEVWKYKYTEGTLSQVIDPMGHEAASIKYHEDGKVKRTRIYHVRTHFGYDGDQTIAQDDNGNASTFFQNSNGITVGIKNPEGYTSRITLTGQNQVKALKHQGNLRGKFDYDEVGNLSRLVRYDLEGRVELTYVYDWENRVLDIQGTDGSQRVLSYDEFGNLLSETENDSVTEYTYNSQGDVISKTVDGEVTEYSHDSDGLLRSLRTNGETSSFVYNETGRLMQITFPDGATHAYEYDNLGFRTSTNRSGGSFEIYQYDSAGNLTESLGETDEGDVIGQQLILNPDNSVSQINFPNHEPLNIEYDQQGNTTMVDWGERTMSCEYDTSGRLTRIVDSELGVSEYSYAANESDIRKQEDVRTAAVLNGMRRASDSFLPSSGALYTRPNGTPWPAVKWDSGLSVLDLHNDLGLVSPDSVNESADKRRRLYDVLASSPQIQRMFDKASNSFFLPAEYATANCQWSECWMLGASINMPGTVTVGVPFAVSVSQQATGLECGTISYNFEINGSFADHGWGWPNISTNLVVQSAGQHDLSVFYLCVTCDGYPQMRFASFDANPDECSGTYLDDFATGWLTPIVLGPREYGTSFYCSNNQLYDRGTVPSSDDDRCTYDPNEVEGDVGWAHTHPFFMYSPNSTEVLNCSGEDIHLNNFQEVDAANRSGEFFSEADEARSSPEFPGYLKNWKDEIKKCTGQNCAL